MKDSDSTSERRQIRSSIKTLMDMKKSDQQAFFQSSAHPLGSGTYNDVFVLDLPIAPSHLPASAEETHTRGTSLKRVVMRLSYYDPKVLHLALNALDGHVRVDTCANGVHCVKRVHVDPESLKLAQRHSRIDPVKVKNNYSLVCKFLIDSGVCPHYVYIYHYRDYKNFTQLVRHLLPEKRLKAPQQTFTNVSFHELFDCNLHHALSRSRLTPVQLKVVIFQVLYSLLCLQHYLPGFRHNDLSLSNILLRIERDSQNDVTMTPLTAAASYRVCEGETYYLPAVGVNAALWDFDLSHAPGKILQLGRNTAERHNDGEGINVCNHIITEARFADYAKDPSVRNINGAFNPSFDVYFFIRALSRVLFGKDCRSKKAFEPVRKFIMDLGVLDSIETYTSKHWPGLDPLSLLRSAFFEEFRSAPAAGAALQEPCYELKSVPFSFLCTLDENSNRREHDDKEGHASDVITVKGVTPTLPPRARVLYDFHAVQ